MKDPYYVLGLSPDSSFDELKTKYSELKNLYSEQRFLDGEAGNEAARNLAELETAWKIIEDEQSKKRAKQEYGSDLGAIDNLIKAGRYDEAQGLLDSIQNRSAEWHYLQSIIFYKREWMNESRAQLSMAVNMEPWNEKYKNAFEKLNLVMGSPRIDPRTIGVDPNAPPPPSTEAQMCNTCSNCCCAYLCMDCCCSMTQCI